MFLVFSKKVKPSVLVRIYRMLAHIPTALRTRYIERDLVEEWVDETGRVVLMGEAAHPLLVCFPPTAGIIPI